jgi:hypothetical protein
VSVIVSLDSVKQVFPQQIETTTSSILVVASVFVDKEQEGQNELTG